MRAADEADYRDFVVVRMDRLRRAAYLLCQDWHTADDLVATVLHKLYRNWHRAQQADSIDAYVHRMLANSWIDERRRPWSRREAPVATVPDQAVVPSGADETGVLELLRGLPKRRRAVLVLRYYCDRSVEETAEILGISAGTVKSQSARALESLRTAMTMRTEVGS